MWKATRLPLCAAAVLALLCGLSPAALALPDSGGFTITDYDVRVAVLESGAYSVAETIQVDFTEPRHGIYRTIPLDGGAVADAGADDVPYTVEESGGNLVIRMGDPDATVTGSQTYRLHYTFLPAQGASQGHNEVYINLIATGWDTTTGSVTFSVTLPKPFDSEKLGFTLGPEGSAGYDPGALSFSVQGNTITGGVNRQLQPYEGLTMRLELPQGYFAGAGAQEAPEPTPGDALPEKPVEETPIEEEPVQNAMGWLTLPVALIVLAVVGIAAGAVAVAVAANAGRRGSSGAGRYDPAMQDLQEMERLRQQQDSFSNNMNPPAPPPPPSPPADSGSPGGGGSW
jgi:hypothetical protein